MLLFSLCLLCCSFPAALTIAITKVFVYDVFALEQIYRIVAFIVLGLLLITSSYLYQPYSKATREFLVRK